MATQYRRISYIIIVVVTFLINLLACSTVEGACFLLFWDNKEKVLNLDQSEMPESEGEPEYVVFYDHDQGCEIVSEVVNLESDLS